MALLARPATADDAQWKRDMEKKIDALSRRLNASGDSSTPRTPAVYEGVNGFAPAASKIYHTSQSGDTTFGGWGEFAYQYMDDRRDNGTASGRRDESDVLHVGFYVGHRFSDKLILNAGVDLEHASTGGGSAARGEIGLEFVHLDYAFNPAIGLRAGLILVPVGLLNENHEPGSYNGVRRPNVENDILPTTWREEGAGVFGRISNFEYRAYLMAGLQGVRDNATGNGVTGFNALTPIRNGRSRGARSITEDPAIAARLDYTGIPGTLLGFSGYRGNSGQGISQFGSAIDGTVAIIDAHGTFRKSGLELKGLYTKGWINDTEQLNAANGLIGPTSIPSEFFGGYLEAAYDLSPLFGSSGKLAPFVRWERIDTQESVPGGYTINPANDRTEYTYGLTYMPHPQVTVKIDYQDFRNTAVTGVNRFNIGLGYAF